MNATINGTIYDLIFRSKLLFDGFRKSGLFEGIELGKSAPSYTNGELMNSKNRLNGEKLAKYLFGNTTHGREPVYSREGNIMLNLIPRSNHCFESELHAEFSSLRKILDRARELEQWFQALLEDAKTFLSDDNNVTKFIQERNGESTVDIGPNKKEMLETLDLMKKAFSLTLAEDERPGVYS